MYCTFCGYPNEDGTKFCENCGRPLASVAPKASMPAQNQPVATPQSIPQTSTDRSPRKTTSWLRRLPAIGVGIVLYGFFLPWVLVSCSLDVNREAGLEASGFDIASGNFQAVTDFSDLGPLFNQSDPSFAPGGELESDAFPLVAIIPLIGLLGLFALSGRTYGSILAILTGLLGLGAIVTFTVFVLYIGNELSPLFHLQFRSGYWLTWLGFLWLLVVGILTIRQRK